MVGSDGTDDDDAAPLFFDMAACTAVRRTRTRTVAHRLADDRSVRSATTD